MELNTTWTERPLEKAQFELKKLDRRGEIPDLLSTIRYLIATEKHLAIASHDSDRNAWRALRGRAFPYFLRQHDLSSRSVRYISDLKDALEVFYESQPDRRVLIGVIIALRRKIYPMLDPLNR